MELYSIQEACAKKDMQKGAALDYPKRYPASMGASYGFDNAMSFVTDAVQEVCKP